MAEPVHSGGCQCGAVRFNASGDDFLSSICHCRMCQKQTGGYFGAFATFSKDRVSWTRGAPSYFQSSNIAKRGFCKDCGTPLTYEHLAGAVSLSIGAFDDPHAVAPDKQLEYSARVRGFDELHKLPVRPDDENIAKNYQHPDHDTAQWPDSQD